MLHKIGKSIGEKKLQKDLKDYCQYALSLGGDAKVISARDVIVDERVLAKCLYPKCQFVGTCLNCPPYSMPPEQTQRIVDKFNYAILVRVKAPMDAVLSKTKKSPEYSNSYRQKLTGIVAKIEARAFYDGHYLALGFGSGSCKNYLCKGEECVAMNKGQGCRYPLLARPSVESVGIDAYRMAARAGWDIYPIGKATRKEDAPHGTRMGLVLID